MNKSVSVPIQHTSLVLGSLDKPQLYTKGGQTHTSSFLISAKGLAEFICRSHSPSECGDEDKYP
jgi:hypothetical protein